MNFGSYRMLAHIRCVGISFSSVVVVCIFVYYFDYLVQILYRTVSVTATARLCDYNFLLQFEKSCSMSSYLWTMTSYLVAVITKWRNQVARVCLLDGGSNILKYLDFQCNQYDHAHSIYIYQNTIKQSFQRHHQKIKYGVIRLKEMPHYQHIRRIKFLAAALIRGLGLTERLGPDYDDTVLGYRKQDSVCLDSGKCDIPLVCTMLP